MIKPEEISVVVQGAIDKDNTAKCLKSIRYYLPKSEIILSTWENSNIDDLDYDILVENKDPGALIQDPLYGAYNNGNRQLLSTQEGIKKATRKYILKLRTDFYLEHNEFLDYWDLFPAANERYKLFKHRVIISSVYSREFSDYNNLPTPFHPADFYFFGLKEDIYAYFINTSLIKPEDLAGYKHKNKEKAPYSTQTWRYAPEQYYCLSFVRQYINFNGFEDWTDYNDEIINLSKNILYNNFIFIDSTQSGITSKKHKAALMLECDLKGIISYNHFVLMYKRYCDNSFNTKEALPIKYKYRKHLKQVFKPFKAINKYVSECVSLIYYICLLFFRRFNEK